MIARFGRPCADCDAAADAACAELCPSRTRTLGVDTPAVSTHERKPSTTEAAWLGERDGLSAHEGAILALIVLGLSNQEIALALHLSMHSTRTHTRSVYRKVGVTRRAQAVAWGVHHGFQLTAPSPTRVR